LRCRLRSTPACPTRRSSDLVETAARALEDLGHHVDILESQHVDDLALARDFLTSWFAYLAWSVEDTKRRTGCADRHFATDTRIRSEEHTSELESRFDRVCRL